MLIDNVAAQYSLSIKKGMHVSWQKPALNMLISWHILRVLVSMVSNQTTA